MAVTTTVAIAATTSAQDSSDITVDQGGVIQVWMDDYMSGSEIIDVYRTDGASIESKVVEDGAPLSLSRKRQSFLLNGPGVFIIKKPATLRPIAVLYDS